MTIPFVEGFFMDASQGRHNELNVVRLALQQGWGDDQAERVLAEADAGTLPWEDESTFESWDDLVKDAVDFLNSKAPEGLEYTSTDGADLGLYPASDE
ncbi:hypothetical protein ACTQ9L_15360 [Deinococcus wulumuqiensis]